MSEDSHGWAAPKWCDEFRPVVFQDDAGKFQGDDSPEVVVGLVLLSGAFVVGAVFGAVLSKLFL